MFPFCDVLHEAKQQKNVDKLPRVRRPHWKRSHDVSSQQLKFERKSVVSSISMKLPKHSSMFNTCSFKFQHPTRSLCLKFKLLSFSVSLVSVIKRDCNFRFSFKLLHLSVGTRGSH